VSRKLILLLLVAGYGCFLIFAPRLNARWFAKLMQLEHPDVDPEQLAMRPLFMVAFGASLGRRDFPFRAWDSVRMRFRAERSQGGGVVPPNKRMQRTRAHWLARAARRS